MCSSENHEKIDVTMGCTGDVQAVASAIQYAPRCPAYYLEVEAQCGGLDECSACLALTAQAVLAIFEEPAA
jgi:hypothetical protein